jgi:hypothetical protein
LNAFRCCTTGSLSIWKMARLFTKRLHELVEFVVRPRNIRQPLMRIFLAIDDGSAHDGDAVRMLFIDGRAAEARLRCLALVLQDALRKRRERA